MNHFHRILSKETALKQAQAFAPLGDPIRQQILALLQVYGGDMSVEDLTEVLEISQSNTSHHLGTLLRTGYVVYQDRGVYRYYMINPARCSEMAAILAAFGQDVWIEPNAAER